MIGHTLIILDAFLSKLGLGEFAHHYSYLIHTWLVMLILILSSLIFVRGVKLLPDRSQLFFEVLIEKLENFMVDISGPEGRFFYPFIATLFIFIFAANLLGLIPGFESPTANINTTLSMAILTFIYTHIIGIRFHGVKYIKHFLGPVWWLIPLYTPIEVLSHFARIMSLSVRLFGNIFGKELILTILFMLAGIYLVPLPLMFLGLLVSFIQALIFTVLAIIYFAGAMEEAHTAE